MIYPDVIVHKRGHDEANLLAIEVKKSTNGTPRECDWAKLQGLQEDYGYEYAVLVDLPVGNRAGEDPDFEWL